MFFRFQKLGCALTNYGVSVIFVEQRWGGEGWNGIEVEGGTAYQVLRTYVHTHTTRY